MMAIVPEYEERKKDSLAANIYFTMLDIQRNAHSEAQAFYDAQDICTKIGDGTCLDTAEDVMATIVYFTHLRKSQFAFDAEYTADWTYTDFYRWILNVKVLVQSIADYYRDNFGEEDYEGAKEAHAVINRWPIYG